MKRPSVTAALCAAALALPLPAAALVFNTYAFSFTGSVVDSQDDPGNLTYSFSSHGPLGGTYSHVATASASFGVLRATSRIDLTDYAPGSYVGIQTPSVFLGTGQGQVVANQLDGVQVQGPNATYDLALNFQLDGNIAWDVVNFVPLITVQAIASDSGFVPIDVQNFMAPAVAGPFSLSPSLTLRGLPANTDLNLLLLLLINVTGGDSYDDYARDPFDTNLDPPFDPATDYLGRFYTLIEPTDADGNPQFYSAFVQTDVGNTLRLTSATVSGGGRLVSLSGATYPGQTQIPEPPIWPLMAFCVAVLGYLRRR